MIFSLRCLSLLLIITFTGVLSAGEPQILNVWPDQPPGPARNLPVEGNPDKPGVKFDHLQKTPKLTNVTIPQLYIYQPLDKPLDAAVIVCPGGGHNVLAWDHEGAQIADWLNSLGITAVILKYRVPFQNPDKKWEMAVQDAERSTSLIRSQAAQLKIDPKKIGMIGFSAGGETTAYTSLMLENRQYQPIDDIDKVSCRPDFAMVIYPGGLLDPETNKLRDFIKVTPETPPMFFVHAFDDRVNVLNSLLLAEQLKLQKVPFECHIYPTGGHGYGLRPSKEPVSKWPAHAEIWMRGLKVLPPVPADEPAKVTN